MSQQGCGLSGGTASPVGGVGGGASGDTEGTSSPGDTEWVDSTPSADGWSGSGGTEGPVGSIPVWKNSERAVM